MKKIAAAMLLALGCALLLAGCLCRHDWQDAKCESPMTCALCGKTQGEPLDHDWTEADCENPESCRLCGETRNEPLGHEWQEASCLEAAVCIRCEAREGEPLGHDWQEATCQRPGTCARCGETEGDIGAHDYVALFYGMWDASFECRFCGDMEWENMDPVDFALERMPGTWQSHSVVYAQGETEPEDGHTVIFHEDGSGILRNTGGDQPFAKWWVIWPEEELTDSDPLCFTYLLVDAGGDAMALGLYPMLLELRYDPTAEDPDHFTLALRLGDMEILHDRIE